MQEWPDDKLLTAEEVSTYLGVKGTNFKEARRLGHIPEPIYIGTSPRWRWGDMKEWAKALALVKRMTPAVFRRSESDDFGRKRSESDDSGPSETVGENPPSGRKK